MAKNTHRATKKKTQNKKSKITQEINKTKTKIRILEKNSKIDWIT